MRVHTWLVPAFVVALSSCIWTVRGGKVTRLSAQGMGTREVVTPLKAFTRDASVIVFPDGASLGPDSIHGRGERFALGLGTSEPVTAVSVEDLIGVEVFEGKTDVVTSVALSAVATAGGAALAVGAIKALFGSCPTFYGVEGADTTLQAEGFSYSIAQLFEARDVDALRLHSDADGVVRLEMRNEALETHYVNHVALLEARHRAGLRVLPDERGTLLAVGATEAPSEARDRDGRSVLAAVAAVDGKAFATSEARLAAASASDSRDWIALTFPNPGGDTAAVVLRLRNSLLNTVLFYEEMLGSTGGASVDWLGRDLNRIAPAVELGRWVVETMGLRVEVDDGRGWKPVARLPDTGPIAWTEVAIRVPLPDTDSVRVRIQFLADEWRIDRIGLASDVSEAEAREWPVARVVDRNGRPSDEARRRVSAPDEEYLVTYPGFAATLEFDPGPVDDGQERSFLLTTQGYYTEWLRPDWIRADTTRSAFRPGPEAVAATLDLWRRQRSDFEARFFATRIPVR